MISTFNENNDDAVDQIFERLYSHGNAIQKFELSSSPTCSQLVEEKEYHNKEQITATKTSSKSYEKALNSSSSHHNYTAFLDVLRMNKNLSHLNLSDSKIGTNGFINLSKALIVARMCQTKTIKSAATITHLDLSYNSEIGCQGYKALVNLLCLSNSSIRSLYLCNNHVSVPICEIISSALSRNRSITTLDLSRCQIDDEGCQILANGILGNNRNKSALTTLNLSSNKIGFKGSTVLANVLDSPTTALRELNLECNEIPFTGYQALSSALCNNVYTSLKTLNLSSNNYARNAPAASAPNAAIKTECKYYYYYDKACVALGNALRFNQILINLDFSYNQIGDKGCSELASALAINVSLQSINLSGNKITNTGCQSLANALRVNDTLLSLNLCDNDIGSGILNYQNPSNSIQNKANNSYNQAMMYSNRSDATQHITSRACEALASALSINVALTNLDLSDNQMNSYDCQLLVIALNVNTTLENFNLSNNHCIGRDGQQKLQDLIDDYSNNKTHRYLRSYDTGVANASISSNGENERKNDDCSTSDNSMILYLKLSNRTSTQRSNEYLPSRNQCQSSTKSNIVSITPTTSPTAGESYDILRAKTGRSRGEKEGKRERNLFYL